jgi:hypothetical protein
MVVREGVSYSCVRVSVMVIHVCLHFVHHHVLLLLYIVVSALP